MPYGSDVCCGGVPNSDVTSLCLKNAHAVLLDALVEARLVLVATVVEPPLPGG